MLKTGNREVTEYLVDWWLSLNGKTGNRGMGMEMENGNGNGEWGMGNGEWGVGNGE